MAGRAGLIAQVRREVPNVLVLDSGDILIGTAMSSVFRGEPDILAMNLMRYDAMAVGNHEFDFGLDHFRKLQQLAKFPMISTSVRAKGKELTPLFILKTVSGLRVLIFSGLDNETYPDSIHPAVVSELEYFDPISSAQGLVRGLGRGADLIIALTHMRTDKDLALAKAVPQIHVIVGGHTEGFEGIMTAAGDKPVESMANPSTIYVKTQRLGATLGRLDLEIVGGRIRRAVARNLPITPQTPVDPQAAGLVKDYEGRLKTRFSESVGRASQFLDGERETIRTKETNLGNLVADVMRQFGKTDVAIMNAGGIRGSLSEGPITLGDTFRVLAFDNTLVTLQVTGGQLREALENGVSQVEQGAGRFPQVSGLSFVYERVRPIGQRVVEVRVGSQPLDPARLYSVATNDFVAGGGDGYATFRTARQVKDTQSVLRDIFVDFIRRVGMVSAKVEGRITAR